MAEATQGRGARIREILLPSPVRAVGGITSLLVREARQAAGIVRASMQPDRPDPRVAAVEDRDERFRIALEVAGRTEADLPAIERAAGTRFETWAALSMFALMWLVVAPRIGLGGVTGILPIDLFLPLGFTAFILARTLAAAVTLHRIRRRSMVPLREFLREPAAWIGEGARRAGTLCVAALAAGAGVAALLPFPALAQAAGGQAASAFASLMTNGGAEDLSLEWLRTMFPAMAFLACPSSGACAAGTNDTLAAMMGTFNAALLGLGSFMLAFQTVIATVATAHEGKVMGQRWHTAWAPIRVVAGVGLLVPVNGYNSLQHAVLMVIVLGYNMANALWVTYVDKVFSGQMASAATATVPDMGLDLAHSILASETCTAVLRGHLAGIQRVGGNAVTPPTLGVTARPAFLTPDPQGTPAPGTEGANGALVWDWGAACGSIRTPAVRNPAGSPNAQAASQVLGNQMRANSQALGLNLSGAGNTMLNTPGQAAATWQAVQASNAAYATFMAARDREVGRLITAVRQSGLSGAAAEMVLTGEAARVAAQAGQAAAAGGNGAAAIQAAQASLAEEGLRRFAQPYEGLRTAANEFNTRLNEAAAEMARTVNSQDSAQFIQRARALGWASAGALNATLLRAAARSSELAAEAIPTMTGPDPSVLGRLARRNAPNEARDRLLAGLAVLQGLLADVNPSRVSSPESVTLGADRQSMFILSRIFKPMSEGIARLLTDSVAYIDPVRPMSSIQNMGNGLLTAAWGSVAVFATMKGGAEGAAQAPFGLGVPGGAVKGALDAVMPLWFMATFAAFVAGALHAYVLPMIPFIMWTYAILAVVSLAAELVIAAPAAAFMHVRADGQELINQEQRTIWVMTFNALLRPSLLLCGLVVANLAFSIMANFLNKLYGPAMSAANGDSLIGIIGFLSLTLLVFYLHYQLVVRCMQLISQVPSAVSEIVGAKDQDRGEHNETNRIYGAVANISSRAGQGGQTAMSNAFKKGEENEHGNNANKPDRGKINSVGPVVSGPTGKGN